MFIQKSSTTATQVTLFKPKISHNLQHEGKKLQMEIDEGGNIE
jgi:hypothetical protein